MPNNSLFISWITGLWYTKIKPRLTTGNRVMVRIRPSMYNSPIQMDAEKSHNCIRTLLDSEEPCMIARYGFTESQLLGRYFIKQKTGLKSQYKKVANWLYNTAGFFSVEGERKESDVDKFCDLMIDYSKDVDLLGSHNGMLEDYVVNRCCPQSELVWFDNLAIAASPLHPWSTALKGKKVLVIHPFADTIASQYKRREKIWGGYDILPEFDLITYKAIQTIAGNDTDKYEDWFQALHIMIEDIKKINFDIAIIGCGAYGFPLAAECKRMGKKAIHLGGQTQVIFGILGKRYDNSPGLKPFINEYWVRPSDEERPVNYKNVEGGCYW